MKNNRGTAVVEFAIILPLLTIIVFGIIEFSFILYDKAIITNASREGARVGILFRVDTSGDYIPPDDTTVQTLIEQRITDYLRNYLVNLGSASVVPSLSNGGVTTSLSGTSPGGTLTVNVFYNYRFLVLNLFGTSTAAIPLSSTTIMRLE